MAGATPPNPQKKWVLATILGIISWVRSSLYTYDGYLGVLLKGFSKGSGDLLGGFVGSGIQGFGAQAQKNALAH